MMEGEKEVLEFAASKGVLVGDWELKTFLQAKRLLAKNPDHADAKTVVENFAKHLATGKRTPSFSEFLVEEQQETSIGATNA
jgi:hypothetical protein